MPSSHSTRDRNAGWPRCRWANARRTPCDTWSSTRRRGSCGSGRTRARLEVRRSRDRRWCRDAGRGTRGEGRVPRPPIASLLLQIHPQPATQHSLSSTLLFPKPYPLAPNPAVNKRDRRSPARGLDHLTIECVTPELDGGRYPVKRVVGDTVWVGADIFKEGHDLLAARAIYKGPGDSGWSSAPLIFDFDNDRWFGSFQVDRIGLWKFTVEGWTDAFGTWRSELRKKVDANV